MLSWMFRRSGGRCTSVAEGHASDRIVLDGPDFDCGDRNAGAHHSVVTFSDAVVWPVFSAAAQANVAIASTLYDDKRQDDVLSRMHDYPVVTIDGESVCADFKWSQANHYHRLVDVHGRLWALRHPTLSSRPIKLLHCHDWSADIKTLIKAIAPNVSFVKCSRWHRYRCETYHHLPFLGRSLLPWKRHAASSIGYLPGAFIRFHQEKTPELFPTGRTFSDRIYVSRADATKRRVLNEPELTKGLAELGFEKVECSKLTLGDQFAAMRSASLIVGAHGAAMANVMAATKRPYYLEVWPTPRMAPRYLAEAGKIGLIDYDSVAGEADDVNADFEAPVDAILGKVRARL